MRVGMLFLCYYMRKFKFDAFSRKSRIVAMFQSFART